MITRDILAAFPSRKRLLVAGTALLALATTGCSISDSISDSISSPFKWSSHSSGSSSDRESYRGDVRDYTEAYLLSSDNLPGYRKGLASIARKYGISNWEADQATFTGIGEGLGKAKVKLAQLEVYEKNLAGGDALKAAAIEKGYHRYMM